ncbi:methylamine utilization protein MauJ [Microbacterium sp. ASV81]|uniref:ApeA N-terminal domain-containing protein n=1 Tax=Microbacterium capsulatum TaxID=3041921 RepID=A0ABU0XHZ2_9MICO|nr:methylamine utilization protein MauJ [Microbacterium sp. ASV81]MDQ4214753.1 hypothetical protein [Microbacterium sp. ASV81]
MTSGRRARAHRQSGQRLTSRSRKKDEIANSAPIGQPLQTARPIVTQEMMYTVVPRFPVADPRSKLGNGPIGAVGEYLVIYRLGVPGINNVATEFNFGTLAAIGDSLIQAHPDAVAGMVEFMASPDAPADHKLELGVNAEHRLASVSVRCHAENFDDAAAYAHDLVMPFLSQLAFTHEVAITTTGREIIEVATEARQLSQTVAGAVKMTGSSLGVLTPEQRRLLASYREGLSASEPLYQVLSFFKVVEGVFSMRKREDAEMRQRGETPDRESERIPEDMTAHLHPHDAALQLGAFTPYLGRKFTDVRDDLRDSLRNNIAHMDFNEDPFSADVYADLVTVLKGLPVLRYMARVMLSSVVPTQENDATTG